MNELIDKLLLLICCLTLYMSSIDSEYVIIPVLLSICISCLAVYFERPRFKLSLYIFYLGTCFVKPGFILFLPLIMYDLLFTDYQFCLFGCFLIIGIYFDFYHPVVLTFTLLFCGLCYLLKYKSIRYNNLMKDYHSLQDTAAELSIVQEEKNRSMLENQDYEISVATLNERNRISKEIHDHVGHLLSRALLQIGALLTISREEPVKEGLMDLKTSLSEGMDSIRASIHNMHDESIDLYGTINGLIKDFTFCPVVFEYDLHNAPLLKVKYCLIAVVKESLSNIIKHSDATHVSIILKEQPGMYQLIVEDNGRVGDKTKAVLRKCRINGEYTEGMGLQGIYDRIKGFRGNLNITADDGFKLFITIPKEA